MTLWFILAIMTAAALGAVTWPFARVRTVSSAGSDLAVYRDQLEEIERDRADGRIGHDEFEAAPVEVSRRLLGAAGGGPWRSAGNGGWRRRDGGCQGCLRACGSARCGQPQGRVLPGPCGPAGRKRRGGRPHLARPHR